MAAKVILLAPDNVRGIPWTSLPRSLSAWLVLLITILGSLAPGQSPAAGTWTNIPNPVTNGIGLMLLLSDGSVMCQEYLGTNWFRLTPDTNGSYVNGSWTNLAPSQDSRLYCSSQVLRDGRVLMAGGEFGSGTSTAEIYDPVSNIWTNTPSPGATISDAISEILPNGDVMLAPVEGGGLLDTLIYSVVSNAWSAGPQLLADQNEASWVKLADGSILTIDDNTNTSERFIPSLNQWIADSTVPTTMYNALGELGPGFLLPNGSAFFIGATNHTAIYTPSGTTNPGAWTAGPDIPNNLGANDAPAAMMVNGKILCALGDDSNQIFPTYFYEYDYVSNNFTQVSSPTGGFTDDIETFTETMLDLPDGTVLFASGFYGQLYSYSPDGSPLSAGKPAISSVTTNGDGSFHVTGTLFNGISEGAAYGDDWQMNSDYPIARLTNSSGNVLYARTFNWSCTGVMTGTNVVSTEMNFPAGLTPGTYSLFIVANGISSDAFSFQVPVGTSPVSILATLNGTNLNLAWPADHTGWRLLSQTNNLASGVSLNTNDWGPVSGSSLTNQICIPIDPTQPAGFFRLTYP